MADAGECCCHAGAKGGGVNGERSGLVAGYRGQQRGAIWHRTNAAINCIARALEHPEPTRLTLEVWLQVFGDV
jgi:hypothetical protein